MGQEREGRTLSWEYLRGYLNRAGQLWASRRRTGWKHLFEPMKLKGGSTNVTKEEQL